MTKWILIGVVFLATSCAFIKNEDSDIMEREMFIDVLVDVHFADAIISEKGFRITNDSLRISRYYDDIMKKHNISRKQFDRTIDFYTKNSEDYKRVYDEVIKNLTRMQDEFKEGDQEK